VVIAKVARGDQPGEAEGYLFGDTTTDEDAYAVAAGAALGVNDGLSPTRGEVKNLEPALEGPYTEDMSTLHEPREPEVRAYPPEEALRRSRPLPRREDLVVDEVPADEWVAFQEALAET
jgi:hypothetical protein